MSRRISVGVTTRGLGSINLVDSVISPVVENENIILRPLGTGIVEIDSDLEINDGAALLLKDNDSSNWIALTSPAALTTNTTYTLPLSDGAGGQVLTTSGAGVLSWTSKTIDIVDTTSSATLFPTLSGVSTGNPTQLNVTSTKLTFDPNTGVLTTPVISITATTASTSTTTGALIVSGGAGIAGAIYAGSIQNTPIGSTTRSSGAFTTLTSNAATTFTQNTGSTSTTTGTLVVTGGVGISERLYAGSIQNTPIGSVTRNTGAFTTLTSNNSTTFTATTASTSTSTGALVVSGGVGIAGNLYAGGAAIRFTNSAASTSTTTGALVVTGGVGIGGALYGGNLVRFTNNTASTSVSTGALVVTGGVGVGGRVTANNIQITATTASTSTTTGALIVAGGIGTNARLTANNIVVNGGTSTMRQINPEANNTYDLGTTALRWRNIFTQDLHLSNGIGDYTIVEGEDDLFVYNNKRGKVYKFALVEVDPSEATPKIEDLNKVK